jgi:hypothetical protein
VLLQELQKQALMQDQQQHTDVMRQRGEDAQRQQSQFSANLSLNEMDMAQRGQEQQADDAFRQAQLKRQQEQDEVAATARRQETNHGEVRRLAIEGLRQRTAQPRDAQLMAASEGVDIPMDVLDPEQPQRQRIELENLRSRNQMREIGAQGAEQRKTAGARVGLSSAGEPTGNAPSPYAQERNVRNLESLDALMGKVGNWTAGAGSLLANVPGTDARDFAAELDTLKANIAFGELTAMREASKTGGALGAISDRELALLSSALGALDPGQSPAHLKAQLQKIRDSIARWTAAQGGGATPPLRGGGPGPGPAAGGFRILSVED